jgi:hypothetical protein
VSGSEVLSQRVDGLLEQRSSAGIVLLQQRLTETGARLGEFPASSPEQLLAQRDGLDRGSDSRLRQERLAVDEQCLRQRLSSRGCRAPAVAESDVRPRLAPRSLGPRTQPLGLQIAMDHEVRVGVRDRAAGRAGAASTPPIGPPCSPPGACAGSAPCGPLSFGAVRPPYFAAPGFAPAPAGMLARTERIVSRHRLEQGLCNPGRTAGDHASAFPADPLPALPRASRSRGSIARPSVLG